MTNPLNQPLISIIIPTLNEEKHIGSLLESLQAFTGVEVIVCDGGSSDSTLDICSRFPVRLLSSPMGRGVQLNNGAEAASGSIFLFLHADCRIDIQVLDDIRSAVSQGCNWGCCSLVFDENRRIFRTIAFFSNLRSGIFSICFGDQAIFCERNLFSNNHGFRQLIFLEDLDFSITLRRQQRAKVIKGKVTASSRRYRQSGIWKTIIKTQIIKMAYAVGIKPENLWKWYTSH